MVLAAQAHSKTLDSRKPAALTRLHGIGQLRQHRRLLVMDSAPCHVHLAARLLGFFQLLEAGGLGFGGGFPFTRGKRKRTKSRAHEPECASLCANPRRKEEDKLHTTHPNHVCSASFQLVGAGVPISKTNPNHQWRGYPDSCTMRTAWPFRPFLCPQERDRPTSPGFLSSLHLPLLFA